MMNKPKPCKGTGKAKGYGCQELQVKRRYGLGFSCGCFSNWLINTPEGKELLDKSTIRAKRKVSAEKKKIEWRKKKEWKQKHKSIAKLVNEARIPFQKWIRLRDKNLPCISCGNNYADIYDAGHYYKAELFTGMIFNEMNVHKQCRKCNSFLGGNESQYRKGLIRRYGQDYVFELDQISNARRTYRYSRQELIDIKQRYQEKLRKNKEKK